MRRLKKEEIILIKDLYQKGQSLRKIQKILDLPLSTIQYHVGENKGMGRIKRINLPESNFMKGELVGAFAGDGSYYHDTSGRRSDYRTTYFLSYKDDQKYANYLESVLKSIGLSVNKSISKNKKGEPSCLRIWVCSVELISFIKRYLEWKSPKTYSVKLKEGYSLDHDFLFGFARGLMDTDGFVESHRVACASVSRGLINNLRNIFKLIGINSNIKFIKKNGNRKSQYRVRVKKSDLAIFYHKIGFSNKRKQEALLKILNGVTRI